MNPDCVVKSARIRHRVMSASFLMGIDATPANMASRIRAWPMIWVPISSTTCSPGAQISEYQPSRCGCVQSQFEKAGDRGFRNPRGGQVQDCSPCQGPSNSPSARSVQAVGRLDLLPSTLVTVLREAERATADYDSLKLTIAIAYGGHEEIADAVRGLVRQKMQCGVDLDAIVDEITPSAIAEHLYTVGLPNLDLIIRTSGEIRLSGFLLWQSVHSEFYFSDVDWPEFRRVDFLRAVRSFQLRSRRFGR